MIRDKGASELPEAPHLVGAGQPRALLIGEHRQPLGETEASFPPAGPCLQPYLAPLLPLPHLSLLSPPPPTPPSPPRPCRGGGEGASHKTQETGSPQAELAEIGVLC